ncbi:arylsulfatase [Dietzia sp. CH92]|uniref:arylsulfatase n=1 Tax=Dietzia sp. CH92 TaxID=3051823 RepID=UPI0028D62688|nr:arylsulfatase [Dietzia sp. CH92]
MIHTTSRRRSGPLPTGFAFGAAVVLSAALAGCGSSATSASVAPTFPIEVNGQERPNVLMVLLDDLGYSDLGVYGGEAETPVLDALASQGAQFTDFHATPLCAPTRAALLTGQDPHMVGLGSMEGMAPPGVDPSTPGYKGSLEGELTSIAEVLGDAGYDTYQVGKWHLGAEEGQTPQDLGFDENFTLYDAGASYYSDRLRLFDRPVDPVDTVRYERNGQPVDSLPEDFFATRFYTDEMIDMVDRGAESDRPFFGYLAYTAPHDPLHVENKALIDDYLEIYTDDYDHESLRAERIQRMADRGLVDADVPTRWPEQSPAPETLTAEQRRDLAYRMAVYAATIHETDQQLGRVIDHLKDTGEYDDTLIAVVSDNGSSASTQAMYTGHGTREGWHESAYPLLGRLESYGHRGSFPSIGLSNAQVASGPYFQAKNTLFEGGIRVPAIIKTPAWSGDGAPRIIDTFAHITDLYPTFADYAGADTTGVGLLGDSARPVLEGNSDTIGDDEFGWEHFGHRAYRAGDWKLLFTPEPFGGTGDYALYDLASDPGETIDLSAEHPDIVDDLAGRWDRYAARNGVVAVDFAGVNTVASAAAAGWYAMDWVTEPSVATGAPGE